ncbi:MAG: DUF1592 domain-containing protein [Amphiplicatus sp.]
MRAYIRSIAAAVVVFGGLLASAPAGVAASRSAADARDLQIVATRRLTESQYRNVIAHVFGADIDVNGRFEAAKRDAGLLEVGNSELSVTAGGFVQYDSMARGIAAQVLDADRREKTVPCKPRDVKAADSKCAAKFVESYGELLFRRPLGKDEIDARVALAERGAGQAQDFYKGLELALVSLLDAPEFLFRVERAEPDPAKPGKLRLDAYTKASRLSFLLWDAAPDAELLAAAAKGKLHTESGLDKELSRMVASPRLEDGVRAFFADFLQLDALHEATKDVATYPKFSQSIIDSAREETLRMLVDRLVAEDGDYRDIFTTRTTVLNRHLAAIYNVPFLAGGKEWARFTFPAEAERSGVLTQASFLSSFAHAAASSPTRRGVKINEIYRCSPTPDPPADVDFSKVQAIDKGTVRQRLVAHMENPGCAACHRASDPIGLTLEHFDGIGQKRTMENGMLIDVSADMGGKKFIGAPGLGEMLRDNTKIPSCLVQQVYAYGVGHKPSYEDEDYIDAQTEDFAENGYRLKPLFRAIGASSRFLEAPASMASADEPHAREAAAE